MNAAVDDSSDQLEQNSPEGPGARLRAARLESGLELGRVAAQLHLQPPQVEALERDDYDGFAARVFVRGYVRNYARLVNLSADSMLAMFDAVYPDPERTRQLRRVGSHKPQVGSGHGAVRMVSWALLLGILALFLVWWAGYLELNGSNGDTDSSTPAITDSTAPPSLPDLPLDESTGQLPLPAASTPLEQDAQDAVAPVATESGVPMTELSPPVDAESAPSADTAERAAQPVPVSEPLLLQVEPQAQSPLSGQPEVVLSLSGPCWVQIRDSSNSFKLIGEFKAGTRRVLAGTPPYRILLGNAAVAELTVDGQVVDLAPYTRGQVARFSLDPSAQ